ncbi:MAG: zinc ribbon domain-containing protein [Myxococcota bacterium]
MQCQACGHECPDDSAFCPYCGARPDAAAEADDKTVSMSADELNNMLGGTDDTAGDHREETEDRTVSMSPEEMRAVEEAAARGAEEAPEADPDDRTVAMRMPPEFFEEAERAEAERKEGPRRSKTIFGHPGLAAAAQAQGDREPSEGAAGHVDPLDATREARPVAGEQGAVEAADEEPATPAGVAERAAEPAPAAIREASAAGPAPGGASPPPPSAPPAPPSGPGGSSGAPQASGGSGGGAGPWVVLGLAALVVVGLVVAAVLLFRGDDLAGAAGDVAAANLPKDLDVVAGVDFERLRSSWVYDHVREDLDASLASEGLAEEMAALGVTPESFEALAAGTRFGDGPTPDFAAALRADIDPEGVRTALEEHAPGGAGGAREIGGITFYGDDRGLGGVVGGDTVLSGTPALLEEVAAVRGGAASVADNEELLEGLGTVDTDAAVWIAVRLNDQMLALAMDGGGGVLKDHIAAGDRFALSADVPDDLVLRVGAVLGDEERAEGARNALDQGLALVRMMLSTAGDRIPEAYREDVREMMNDIALEQSGRRVTLRVTVPRGVIDKALADLKEQIPAELPSLEGP